MKILIGIATMQPGGAERQVTYLANALVRAGHEVHVVLIDAGPYYEGLASSGAAIHFVHVYPKRIRFVLPLLRLFHSIRPDVVYLWQRPLDVLGGIAALLARLPTLHAERTDPDRLPLRGPKKMLRDCVVRLSRGVIANSAAGASYWRNRLPVDRCVVTVPNIVPEVDLAAVLPAHESAGCAVIVGRLDVGKNIEAFLKGVRSLRRQGVMVPVLIVGEGPLSAALQLFIAESNLDGQVKLCGFRKDVWELMKGSLVVASLSRYEGEPNAVLEAASMGCRLLLSDIPAHRSIGASADAFFVNPDSEDDISAVLRHVVCDKRPRPTPNRERMVSDRSGERIGQRHLAVFTRVLSDSKGASWSLPPTP